jgi:hypothetical protein
MMDEQEIAAATGWMLVASGALAMTLSSLSTLHGYRATSAGLFLALLGLLIARHIWAAAALLGLTLARFGYYLFLHRKGRHGEKEHNW